MHLTQFLSVALSQEFWKTHNVVGFVSSSYPYYFFERIIAIVDAAKVFDKPRSRHAFFTQTTFDIKQWMARLQQATLGQAQVYWLGDTTLLFSAKQQEQSLKFLAEYQGPNSIIFFSDQPVKLRSGLTIDIPAVIKQQEFMAMLDWFALHDVSLTSLQHPKKRELLRNLIKKQEELSLDTACFLFEYIALTSVKQLEIFEQYLLTMPLGAVSMQDLVESFFQRNPQRFFKAWSMVSGEYPAVFWVSFWADLIWRAHSVVVYLKNNRLLDAKKSSYKLPYSFMNNGWQRYSTQYLAKLYTELYTLDFASKRGALSSGFELFFVKHFVRPS